MATALVLVAHTCPLPARGWGAFLPLHALRTERDRGVGSYDDLGRPGPVGRRPRGRPRRHAAPLPGVPGRPDGPEPVPARDQAGSKRDPVDPTGLPELAVAPQARRLLASDAVRRQVETARAARLSTTDRSWPPLRAVLVPMVAALFAGTSTRRSELEAFAATRPELVSYARFRSACERLGSPWPTWSGAEAAPRSRGDERRRRALSPLRPVGRRSTAGQCEPGEGRRPLRRSPRGRAPLWLRPVVAAARLRHRRAAAGPHPTPSSPPARTGGSHRCIPTASGTTATATSSPSCARPSATPTPCGSTT